MAKTKVFCFGNEFIQEDSKVKALFTLLEKEFPQFQFISIKDSFQILSYKDELENSIILDVVKGIKEPRLVSVDELKSREISTTHDFDLGFILKLLDKKTKIVGIPRDWDDVERIKELLIAL